MNEIDDINKLKNTINILRNLLNLYKDDIDTFKKIYILYTEDRNRRNSMEFKNNSINNLNRITTLEDANRYLQEKYSLDARIEMINRSTGKNKVKYKFINVPIMQNYKGKFKTITKAMNCLLVHEHKWKR